MVNNTQGKEPYYGFETLPGEVIIGKNVDLTDEGTPKGTTKVVDLGCGIDASRWLPGTIKIDNNVVDDEVISANYVHDELPFTREDVDEFKLRYSLRQNLMCAEVLPHILMKLAYHLKPGGLITIVDYCELYGERLPDADDHLEGQLVDVDYETFKANCGFPKELTYGHLHGLELEHEFIDKNEDFDTFTWHIRKVK